MQYAVSVALVAWLAAPAVAQPPVSAHGQMDGPAPLPSMFDSDDRIHLYIENFDVSVTSLEVDVGPGLARYEMGMELPPGHAISDQTVSCYLIHFSPASPDDVFTGRVSMEDGTVLLGLAFTDERLATTDAVCKPGGVMYPTTAGARGLVFSGATDVLSIGDPDVEVSLSAGEGEIDQVRVIVGRASSGDAGVSTDAGAIAELDAGTPSGRDAGVIAVDEWNYRGSGGCTCAAIGEASRFAPASHGLVALVVCFGLLRRRRRV